MRNKHDLALAAATLTLATGGIAVAQQAPNPGGANDAGPRTQRLAVADVI